MLAFITIRVHFSLTLSYAEKSRKLRKNIEQKEEREKFACDLHQFDL